MVVAFFIRLPDGPDRQAEAMRGGKDVDAAGFHRRDRAARLPSAGWITYLAELAHAAAKSDRLVVSVQKKVPGAGVGHRGRIPAVGTEEDADPVTIEDRASLVIRRRCGRAAVVMTVPAAAELAFKNRPRRGDHFVRVDNEHGNRAVLFE